MALAVQSAPLHDRTRSTALMMIGVSSYGGVTNEWGTRMNNHATMRFVVPLSNEMKTPYTPMMVTLVAGDKGYSHGHYHCKNKPVLMRMGASFKGGRR